MKLHKNESGIANLLLIGAAVFFVGSTGTVVAADRSKPGDFLYGLDRASENVSLALAVSDNLKETTHRRHAKERLEELKALFAEKDMDVQGILTALDNLEEHQSRLGELSQDDDDEQEIEDEISSNKSELEKLYEGRQKELETLREELKQQYEAAKKKGDTVLAAALKARIEGFEDELKSLEKEREAAKKQDEQEQKTTEETREAAKQQAEQQYKETENMTEAEKKAAEAAREAAKQAAEDHDED